jgi:hypothetical protein
MKLILPGILLLLFASPTYAIIGAARGSGGNNTGATTLVINPGSDFSNPSMGVLCVAVDNAGAGGNTAISPTSITDSDGNLWTRRVSAFQDPGAANAGVEISIYTAPITTAFQTTDNITITWGGGTSPTAKAWTLTEFTTSSIDNILVFKDGAGGTGANDGTPSITTTSVTNNDAVVGMGGAEAGPSTWTGDADTTNGSWVAQVTTAFGTGTSAMSITSQRKIVTGSGTQTYNPTLTAADRVVGWVAVSETAAVKRRPLVIL